MSPRKTMAAVSAMFSIVGLAALTGCDTIYGLSTHAQLAQPPVTACVDTALRSVEGVSDVRYSTSETRSRTIFGGVILTVSDVWTYGTPSGDWAVLQIITETGARGESAAYINGIGVMNARVPEAELDAYRPVMDRVNAAMSRSCGLHVEEAGRITRR